MTKEQATKIANRVLAGFGFPMAEPPKLGFDTWQVFYSRDGETVSAFMDNGLDLNRIAEQLEVAIRSELPFPPLPTAPPMSKRYPQSVIAQTPSPCSKCGGLVVLMDVPNGRFQCCDVCGDFEKVIS